MKSRNTKKLNRPFKNLGELIEKSSLTLSPFPEQRPSPGKMLSARQEAELFKTAMTDVVPLTHNTHWQWPKTRLDYIDSQNHEDDDALSDLKRLITTGHGFVIAQTDEYMEATGPGTNPQIASQLHQGRFSIQDHIDLHGMFVPEAEQALHNFIRQCLARNRRGVLVVHGRGLTSPKEPVLKQKVYTWLTRGPLRSYVIALASAKACDGGAGATYVLLRRRPITSGKRKAAAKTT
ncbi:MAG: DNA mismatch repair protein MutS [Desulfobacteraceae bacterium]|nr:DNA mismatch repair protein MutS [Desulfobacteraceae bacterium]